MLFRSLLYGFLHTTDILLFSVRQPANFFCIFRTYGGTRNGIIPHPALGRFPAKTAAASLPLPPHRKASACHVFYMPIPAGSKTGYFRVCGRTRNGIIPHSAPGWFPAKNSRCIICPPPIRHGNVCKPRHAAGYGTIGKNRKGGQIGRASCRDRVCQYV